jgi:hypothetical protein
MLSQSREDLFFNRNNGCEAEISSIKDLLAVK